MQHHNETPEELLDDSAFFPLDSDTGQHTDDDEPCAQPSARNRLKRRHGPPDASPVGKEQPKTDTTLRQQIDFTRALTNGLGEGIYALDTDGRLTFMNPAAEHMLGWTEGELLGQKMHDKVHFKHGDGTPFPASECPLLSVTRARSPMRVEDDVFVRKDGAFLPVAYISSPIISGANVMGAVLAFHDIADQKQIEAERLRLLERERSARHEAEQAMTRVEEIALELGQQAMRLDTIIEAIPDGVYVCDASGMITHLNRHGAELVGLAREEALRSGAWYANAGTLRAFDGHVTPLAEYPLSYALRGETRTDLRYLIRRYGTNEMVPVQVSCAPIRNGAGEIIGGVAAISDISRIYWLERQKDEFLSIASHELKTPLTSLKMLTQLTHHHLSRAGSPEAQYTQRMERALIRMEMLVNDLLDASRIESGKLALRLERCDLVGLCRQVATEQIDIVERTLILDLPTRPIEIVADAGRIGQVITNLITNALKYSPPSQPVELRLRREHDQALISVRDYGAGIPVEALPQLFERFYRAPGVQVQSGSGVGLGLGLYITREIVERHGGRIWAESEVGQGSVFFVALPLAEAGE